MSDLNRVTMICRLCRDPEFHLYNGGHKIAKFRVAATHRWISPTGEKKEQTCFVEVHAFGKAAEIIDKYARRGGQMYIEGRLAYDAWQDPEGRPRSRHYIHLEEFQLLRHPPNRVEGGRPEGAASPAPPAPALPEVMPDGKIPF